MSVSFAQIPSVLTDKSNLKVMELFYVSLMCLVANFLSSIALEVGTRLPLGQTASAIKSTGFPAFFHRAYNLKVKLLVSSMVSGCISTTLVVLGKQSGLPYLYIPWLVNTLRGMAFCEGPTLLGLAYMLLPESDVPAKSFIFITLLLYVEEIFLWEKIFSSFRDSWIKYRKKKRFNSTKNVENSYTNHKKGKKSIPEVQKSSKNQKMRKSSESSGFLNKESRLNNSSRSSRSYFTNSTG